MEHQPKSLPDSLLNNVLRDSRIRCHNQLSGLASAFTTLILVVLTAGAATLFNLGFRVYGVLLFITVGAELALQIAWSMQNGRQYRYVERQIAEWLRS